MLRFGSSGEDAYWFNPEGLSLGEWKREDHLSIDSVEYKCNYSRDGKYLSICVGFGGVEGVTSVEDIHLSIEGSLNVKGLWIFNDGRFEGDDFEKGARKKDLVNLMLEYREVFNDLDEPAKSAMAEAYELARKKGF